MVDRILRQQLSTSRAAPRDDGPCRSQSCTSRPFSVLAEQLGGQFVVCADADLPGFGTVDETVVASAEKGPPVDVCRATPTERNEVVGVALRNRGLASREDAAAVADGHRPALCRAEEASGPTQPQRRATGVDDNGLQVRIADQHRGTHIVELLSVHGVDPGRVALGVDGDREDRFDHGLRSVHAGSGSPPQKGL